MPTKAFKVLVIGAGLATEPWHQRRQLAEPGRDCRTLGVLLG